jgi:translation initiation factor IF-2
VDRPKADDVGGPSMGELAAEYSRSVRARAGGDPDVGSGSSGGDSGGVHRARTQQGRLEGGAVGLRRPDADRLAEQWPGRVAPERPAARQGPGEVAVGGAAPGADAAGGAAAAWRGGEQGGRKSRWLRERDRRGEQGGRGEVGGWEPTGGGRPAAGGRRRL